MDPCRYCCCLCCSHDTIFIFNIVVIMEYGEHKKKCIMRVVWLFLLGRLLCSYEKYFAALLTTPQNTK